MMQREFNHIVAAGSWDHFHAGHKQFLTTAFEKARLVSVGITADEMIGKKPLSRSIESFDTRKREVEEFLRVKGFQYRSKLVKLTDIFGPAISDQSMEVLLVTQKTFSGGEEVNQKRQQMGLAPLSLIKVNLKKAQDGKEISSERIRRGEINREGKVYWNWFKKQIGFHLPKSLRLELKQPYGKLFPGSGELVAREIKNKLKRFWPVICVGDVVSNLFLKYKLPAQVFVVDLLIERHKKFRSLAELGFAAKSKHVVAINKPGELTTDMAAGVKNAIDEAMAGRVAPVVWVDGEEDLAVIPAVLAAPLGATVLYGQPHQGVVMVEITEEKKERVNELVKRMA